MTSPREQDATLRNTDTVEPAAVFVAGPWGQRCALTPPAVFKDEQDAAWWAAACDWADKDPVAFDRWFREQFGLPPHEDDVPLPSVIPRLTLPPPGPDPARCLIAGMD